MRQLRGLLLVNVAFHFAVGMRVLLLAFNVKSIARTGRDGFAQTMNKPVTRRTDTTIASIVGDGTVDFLG